MKDRRHYGLLTEETVVEVTPEQAGAWLNTRPPAPVMWSRGASNNEKSQRLADLMRAGEWDNDREWDEANNRPNEPVMINADHGYVLGGHHRLTAVTLLGRPQELRVRFYTKPEGWDKRLSAQREAEAQDGGPRCPVCSWPGSPEEISQHLTRAHRYERTA